MPLGYLMKPKYIVKAKIKGKVHMKKIIVLFFLISMLLFSGCDTTHTEIVMPHDSSYYDEYDGTLDELVKHFEDLGFTDIETTASSYSGYARNIIDFVSAKGYWTGFKEGDTLYSYDTIEIHYYDQCNNLTVDNCPDLASFLAGEMDYMAFAEKYDGKYIEFDGCITYYSAFMDNTSFVIKATGGDYEDNSKPNRPTINVDGNNLLNPSPDTSVNRNIGEAKNVKIIGEVSRHQSEYYNHLDITAVYLQEHN